MCSFECMTSLTREIQFNRLRLCNLTSSWKMVKNTVKVYYRRCFLHKSTKKCKENQGWHVFYIRGMTSHTLNAKLCKFITSWNLMKSPQNFVQRPFSIQLTKIWHKNRGEALAWIPLSNSSLSYPQFQFIYINF